MSEEQQPLLRPVRPDEDTEPEHEPSDNLIRVFRHKAIDSFTRTFGDNCTQVPFAAYALLFVAAAGIYGIIHLARNSWIHPTPPPFTGTLAVSPPYYPAPEGGSDPAWADAYRQAAELVNQMTLVEKVNITTGVGWANGFCVGNTGSVERLGIPSLCLQDGPMGLRFADNATAFPASITLGMSWNRDLMREKGHAHGREARGKGINVLLGPSVGAIGRSPYGGRNWEGFGADPFIQGIGGAEVLSGIQSEGVIATIKHLVGNEQEHFRRGGPEWANGSPISEAISTNIDDRTMHELYLWPFAHATKAGVGSAMCGYNQINNSYACQNSALMNGLLKDELGFQGFIQSDWQAQRSGIASSLAGLDMTMPGDGFVKLDRRPLWGSRLTESVLNATVPIERVNDMVLRTLAAWIFVGQNDQKKWPLNENPNFSSWTHEREGWKYAGSPDKEWGVVNKWVNVQADHGKLARRIAAEGTVLLKNDDHFLPLNENGQSQDGNSKAASKKDKGQKTRIGIFGDDAHFVNQNKECKDNACNGGTLIMGWGSGTAEPPYVVYPLEALEARFKSDQVSITTHLTQDLPDPAVVAEQDICLVFIRANAGEGYLTADGIRGDRNHLYPLADGDKLVSQVALKCANTVVIVHTVGAVIMDPWADLPNVKSIIWANLPGQEAGNALVDVLFGDHNPSGRLTYTIARNEKDYGPAAEILRVPEPGTGPGTYFGPQQDFDEGVYVDYRHFDKFDISPHYEFGFGLSYTNFEIVSESVKIVKIDHEARKRAAPLPRPDQKVFPPKVDTTLPSPIDCAKPRTFRALRRYVYSWLEPGAQKRLRTYAKIKAKAEADAEAGIVPEPKDDKPDDSHTAVLSPAGGGPGGNPDLWNEIARVQGTVKNTGSRAGAIVIQLYVSLPQGEVDGPADGSSATVVEMPIQVLRGFSKSSSDLGPGEEYKFDIPLTRRDLSYWSVWKQNWVLPQGEIKVQVGFSSRDHKWSAGL